MESRLLKIEEKLSKLLDGYRRLDDINKNMQSLHQSFQAFNSDFEDFRKKFEGSLKEVGLLKTKVAFLESDNLSLKKQLRSIRQSSEEGYSAIRSCDLEIAGIPPSTGEAPQRLVHDISKKVKLVMNDNGVKSAERLVDRTGKVGNILVSFDTPLIGNEFLECVKKTKLKAVDIGLPGNNAIYVNACLSAYSKSLQYKAKQLKQELGFKFVWVKNGKIFMRKAEKEPAIRISCLEDLEVLTR